jgi:ABC-type dipeptide/oligopeptide/nickel transport system permease subunit
MNAPKSAVEKEVESAAETEAQPKRTRGASQWSVAWRRFKRNKVALVGFAMIAVVFFTAIFRGVIAPYPPRPEPDAFKPLYDGEAGQPPSWKHPFGTSAMGTDIFSDVINGTVYTLYVSIVATIIITVLALVVGVSAGYRGGGLDNVLMRISEVFLVIPILPLILVFARIFQIVFSQTQFSIPVLNIQVPIGLTIVVVIISLFGWAADARVFRGEVLRIKEMEYVQAAKSIGASDYRTMLYHIIPNILSTVIVISTLTMATAILTEAGVSFLGFGDPNTVTWGYLLNENLNDLSVTWWAEVFPGLAVFWSVLGFNLLGDGLADALNPRLRE